jgi:hypothetical protein
VSKNSVDKISSNVREKATAKELSKYKEFGLSFMTNLEKLRDCYTNAVNRHWKIPYTLDV